MLNVILNEPDFAEWMFLVAVIIFIIAAVAHAPRTTPAWPWTAVLVPVGLAVFAFAFLAL